MLESGAPPTEQIHPGEWDGYDDYDPYCGMNGLTAEQQVRSFFNFTSEFRRNFKRISMS